MRLFSVVGVLALIGAGTYVAQNYSGPRSAIPADLAPTPASAIRSAKPIATSAAARSGSVVKPTGAAEATANAPLVYPTVLPVSGPLPEGPKPLFGPNYDPKDGKPVYVCGTDAFASFLTLIQMQTTGRDVAHGFHLGIVPYQLTDGYDVSESQTQALVSSGAWDCDTNTAESAARTGYAAITAIIDESAGGDGMWARNMKSMYDLKGKRIAFVRDTSSEFFMRYVMSIIRLDAGDVKFVPSDTIEEALIAFNSGKADAVSGWEPQLHEAEQGGGESLVTSDQLRIIIDVLMTSRRSIANRPEIVQAFHDAWFETLKAQTEDYDQAASDIAKWGHNDWTSISTAAAASDFREQLKLIAQADLAGNAYVMNNPAPLTNVLNTARKVWAASDAEAPISDASNLIEPSFVRRAAAKAELQSISLPLNTSFSLGAPTRSISANQPVTGTEITVAVLPCRFFEFLPDSTQLTPDSLKTLDLCVVPTLQQRQSVQLRIRGSAAWPGPKGTFTEADIIEVSQARAQSIANYLAAQNIDQDRLIVEGVLPPKDHWESDDPAKLAADRFVEMTLVIGTR